MIFILSSNQWDRSTARHVSTVSAAMTITAPGLRTVLVRGTTAGLCFTWLWSCWCCCGGCTLPGEYHTVINPHPLLLAPLTASSHSFPQDRIQPCTLLAAVGAFQWPAAGCGHAGGSALSHRAASAWLAPLPDLSQHHHLGVHVTPPHLLPQALWRWWKPLWPWHLPQSLGFLLLVGYRGVGAGVLQGTHRPGLRTGVTYGQPVWMWECTLEQKVGIQSSFVETLMVLCQSGTFPLSTAYVVCFKWLSD